MAASRIVFAIGDLISEVTQLSKSEGGPGMELRLDPETFGAVEGELMHHYGASLRKVKPDPERGIARGLLIGGMRVVAVMPGTRWGIGG